jgi:uncharacterized protein with HEPN domain
MSKRDPGILLDDIRAAIGKIDRYTTGLDKRAFLGDDKTIDAVVRNLEIVGEAAKQLPVEFRRQHSAIPWSKIAGLRNRIVHDYAGIDLELVWNILKQRYRSSRFKSASSSNFAIIVTTFRP